MEIKDIKRIIELMKQNELTEFELQEEDFRIFIKRGQENGPQVAFSSTQPPVAADTVAPSVPVGSGLHPPTSAAPAETAKSEDDGLVEITSPIVGTFYQAGSPDADAFVSVGQDVDEDTVVCIIEAMKVMNEIKSEVKGTIRAILVENGTPVEYGQALFKVEPL